MEIPTINLQMDEVKVEMKLTQLPSTYTLEVTCDDKPIVFYHPKAYNAIKLMVKNLMMVGRLKRRVNEKL